MRIKWGGYICTVLRFLPSSVVFVIDDVVVVALVVVLVFVVGVVVSGAETDICIEMCLE